MLTLETVLNFGQMSCGFLTFIGTTMILSDIIAKTMNGKPGSKYKLNTIDLLVRPAAGYVFLAAIEFIAAEAGLI